jgi:predicted RNA methylase
LIRSVTGFDIDQDALDTAQDNLLETDSEQMVDLLHCDILRLHENPRLTGFFDTVIMNPPFGTKYNEGIDV